MTNVKLNNVDCSTVPAGQPCLDPTPPTNITTAGGVYTYRNIITINGITVNARVSIENVHNAQIRSLDTEGDYPDRFQPEIYATSDNGYADFKFAFFDNDDNPVSMYNFAVTAVDNDGNDTDLHEFVEFGGFSSYTLDQDTEIVTSPNGRGGTRFLGSLTLYNGIIFNDYSAVIAEFTAPTHSLNIRLGNTRSGTNRLFSLAFGAKGGEFTTPITHYAPSATLSAPAFATNQQDFLVTATFSEPVTGFDESGVELINGSINAGTFTNINDEVYQFIVKAAAEGTVSIKIPPGSANSTALGIHNTVSNTLNVQYDISPPTAVTLSAHSVAADVFEVSAIFDEPVVGFLPESIDISAGNLVAGSFSGEDEEYSFRIQVDPLEIATVKIPAAVVDDAAGNPNEPSAELLLPSAPSIDKPVDSDILSQSKPEFELLSAPGSEVELTLESPSLPTGSLTLDSPTIGMGGEWNFSDLPLPNGSYTVSAKSHVDGIQSSVSNVVQFEIEVDLPTTDFSDKPDPVVKGPTVTFEFDSPTAETFECSINGGPWFECGDQADPSYTTGPLADGHYSFEVRAVDEAGNRESDPEAYFFEIRSTEPKITFLLPPPALTNNPVLTVVAVAEPADATFECTLNGIDQGACTFPHTVTGAQEGLNTLTIKATDPAGNFATSTLTWTLDTVPPNTFITNDPPSLVKLGEALEFIFDSDDPFAFFECSTDGGATWSHCADEPGELYIHVTPSPGIYTLHVRAVDEAGNRDPTPASHTWKYQESPLLEVVIAPPQLSNNPEVTISVKADPPETTFECILNGDSLGSCTFPKVFSGIEGENTLKIIGTDPDNNTEEIEFTWTQDTTAPETEIVDGPDPYTSLTDAVFEFSSPGHDDVKSYQCRLNSGPWTVCADEDGSQLPGLFTSLPEGSHELFVRAVDEAGNKDDTPAHHSWVIDLTDPEVEVSDGPPSVGNEREFEFVFKAVDNSPVVFECSFDKDDVDSWFDCSSPYSDTLDDDGSYTLYIRATDAAGNSTHEDDYAEWSWKVDTEAPETLIVSPQPPYFNTQNPTLQFGSPDTDVVGYECLLNSHTWASCADSAGNPDGDLFENLPEGTYELFVRAVDEAGNRDPNPAHYSWEILLGEPVVDILAQPDPLSNTALATIVVVSDRPGTTYECNHNDQGWFPCSSLISLIGDEGSNKVEIIATDPAGNTFEFEIHWILDTIAPTTFFNAPLPDALTSISGHDINFSSTEPGPGTSYECKLNNGPWLPCESGDHFTGSEGENTLQIRATDEAGNTTNEADYASHTWTLDTTAPTVWFIHKPGNFTTEPDFTFVFGSDEDPVTFECSSDGTNWSVCPKSYTVTATEGSNALYLRGRDEAGNVTSDLDYSKAEWTLDTGAPDTEIVNPPALFSNNANPDIGFSSSHPDVVAYECQLNSSVWVVCADADGTVIGDIFENLAEGSYELFARAVDEAGNRDPNPKQHNWTVDLTAPKPEFVHTPPALTNIPDFEFVFKADESHVTFECSFDSDDAGSWFNCDSPHTVTADEGSNTFYVRATDRAGNVTAEADYAEWSWTLDTAAPVTTIAAGTPSLTNIPEISFNLSADKDPVTFECNLNDIGWFSCGTNPEFTAKEGPNTLRVRATDSLGNLGPEASVSWTLDTVAPIPSITGSPETLTMSELMTLEFGADEAGASFKCQLNGGAWNDCTSPATFTGVEGSNTVRIQAIDLAGNATGPALMASHTWVLDTTAPKPEFVHTPPLETNIKDFDFVFRANEAVQTFACRLNANPWTVCVSPHTVTAGEGSNTFQVRATDIAGNVTAEADYAEWTWTLDTKAPSLDIAVVGTYPDPILTNTPEISFSFTSDKDPVTFECNLNGIGWFTCSQTAEFIAREGANTLQVRATDKLGNISEVKSVSWTLDTVTPVPFFTGTPAKLTRHKEMVLSFDGNKSGLSFECKFNAENWEPCVSPQTYTGEEGVNTVSLRATDEAGNQTPAEKYAIHSWVLDETAPKPEIVNPPPAFTSEAEYAFVLDADESPVTFKCSSDGTIWQDCSSPHSVTADEGKNEFFVRATDSAGNTTESTEYAKATWTLDTKAPETRIDGYPDAFSRFENPTFRFGSPAPDVAKYECRLDGAPWEVCADENGDPTTALFVGLSEGEHDLLVRAVDVAGNKDDTPAQHKWEIDLTAPKPEFIHTPPELTHVAKFKFAFKADENHVTFECSKDKNNWSGPCTSPYEVTADEGVNTFYVRATDRAGNVTAEADYAEWTWTLDVAAPVTTIAPGTPSLTNIPEISFNLSADKTPVTFECNLNDIGWFSCSANPEFTAKEGPNTLRVRATDSLGNLGPEASVSWTLDTTPPIPSITNSPPALTNQATVLEFAAQESGVSFECKLNDGNWEPCVSPKTFAGVEGENTVTIRATDAATNVTPADRYASHSWVLDNTAPKPEFVRQPPAITNQKDFTFILTADESPVTFECRHNNGTWQVCNSHHLVSAKEGENFLYVRAIDQANNRTDDVDHIMATWVLDTEVPNTLIVDAPDEFSPFADADFLFDSDHSDVVAYECQLDSPDWEICADSTGTPEPSFFAGLEEGSHELYIRAVDEAGNRDPNPEHHSWVVDLTAPKVSFVQTPPSLTDVPAFTFVFEADESPVSFECSRDGTNWSGCSSPEIVIADEGSNELHVRAIDRAGNISDPADHAVWTWTLDTTAPETVIASGPPAFDKLNTASFVFESDVDVDFYECRLDQDEWVRCAENDGIPADFSGLQDGPHILRVRAVDLAGNIDPTPAEHKWVVDTLPPITIIDEHPPEFSASSDAQFRFDANEEVARFECALDSAPGAEDWVDCDEDHLIIDLDDGLHELKVRAIDLAGNVDPTPAVYEWTVDTVEPEVIIGTTPPEFSNSSDQEIELDSEEIVTWECSLNGGDWEPCDATVKLQGLPDGDHTLTVRATDQAGNVSEPVTVSWTVDTLAPVAEFLEGPVPVDSSNVAHFVFDANESPVSWECLLDQSTWSECGSSLSLENLQDGAHTLQIRATDAAGNTSAPAVWEWTVDTLAPKAIFTKKAPKEAGKRAEFEFDSNESPVTWECLLDEDPESGEWQPCESPLVLELEDGDHELHLRAIDEAGNVSEVVSHSWNVDHVAVDLLGDADGDGWVDDTGVTGGGCNSTQGLTPSWLLLAVFFLWRIAGRRKVSKGLAGQASP